MSESDESVGRRRRVSRRAIRETLGFFGVVASMMFVGLEIRQNTAVARGQARQELASLNQEWLLLLSQDEDYHDLWYRAWMDLSELTPREMDRANAMMIAHLRRLENVYFQYRQGLIEESALDSYGVRAVWRLRSPRFDEFWELRKASFDPEFRRFFDEGPEPTPQMTRSGG